MFIHFIITRFNVKYKDLDFGKNKEGKDTTSEEWLSDRFKLFDTYCFPSVEAQTCSNFTWIVLLDEGTPEFYRKMIALYQLKMPNFLPVYIAPATLDEIIKRVKDSINALIKPGDEFVVTSRLDNDDAISNKFIEEVQSHFDRQDNLFINFNIGYQYDINQRILQKIEYKNNHFTSRIERIDSNYKTVIKDDHRFINLENKVIEIGTTPLWMEVIHANNLANGLKPAPPLYSFNDENFRSVKIKISVFNSVLNILGVWALKYIKPLLKKVIRKG